MKKLLIISLLCVAIPAYADSDNSNWNQINGNNNTINVGGSSGGSTVPTEVINNNTNTNTNQNVNNNNINNNVNNTVNNTNNNNSTSNSRSQSSSTSTATGGNSSATGGNVTNNIRFNPVYLPPYPTSGNYTYDQNGFVSKPVPTLGVQGYMHNDGYGYTSGGCAVGLTIPIYREHNDPSPKVIKEKK